MTASGSYGLFLPDIGTIILNATALDLESSGGGVGLNTLYNSNTTDNNPAKLYNAISGSGNFTLNSQENITSDYVFVRAKNSNLTILKILHLFQVLQGTVLYNNFINAPQTFYYYYRNV